MSYTQVDAEERPTQPGLAALSLVGTKRTQLGTAGTPLTSTQARARRLAYCPDCSTPFEGSPFCRHDGTLAEPFDVGERYRVEELLGAGATSLVFGARHLVLGKSVAVKLLRAELTADPDQAQRFLTEARLVSQIAHENIVGVIDFGHDRALDLPYVVMDRLRGPRLAQLMGEGRKLSHERTLPILVQLARALAALHEQGLAHGDLRAKCVALEESSGRRDVVKLCAAGRAIDDEAPTASDVHAVGAIAYEMLTGEPLIDPSVIALGEAAPHALAAAVLRCLELDPSARPRALTLSTLLAQISLPSASPAAPVELVGRMIGSYRVIEVIGTGGMGSVYRAEHPEIGTQVAIKVLLPEIAGSMEAIERFIREARASSAIGSPHIPRYHDFGRLPDGRAYAVMELLNGETLAARLARTGPMSIEATAAIVRATAAALGEAHALGIVHRDIKPENLFFAYDARGQESIKVLDFGIAKVSAGASEKLTQHGGFVGTPAYCAPEQIFGHAIGPATDVYALGATAYEMLTGRSPFEGDLSVVFAAKANVAPPSVRAVLPWVPASVEATISRALARHASDRFVSMHDLEQSVAQWSAAPVVAAPPKKKGWIALAAVALIGVSALGGALLWLAPRIENTAPPEMTAPVIAPVMRVPAPAIEIAPRVEAHPVATAERSAELVAPAAPAARARTPRRIRRAASQLAPDPARPIIADPFAE